MPKTISEKKYFQGILSNPTCRRQLRQILNQYTTSSPNAKRMINSNNIKLSQQMESLGFCTKDLVLKILSDRKLASAFSEPVIEKILTESSTDLKHMNKYIEDPKVCEILIRLQN